MTSSQITYDVFLDYTSSESFLVAELIAKRLVKEGLRPWFDKWSIIPGQNKDRQIILGLSSSMIWISVLGRINFPCQIQSDLWKSVSYSDHISKISVLSSEFIYSRKDLPEMLINSEIIDMRNLVDFEYIFEFLICRIKKIASQKHSFYFHPQNISRSRLKINTIKSYDYIAEKFASQWFDFPPLSPLGNFVRRLPRKAKVLDAGCGPGHHSKFIASKGHDVLGIDISEGMLSIARKRVHSAIFTKMDIQRLNFLPKTFDAIWCAAAMHHIPREETLKTLRGFYRVLKPGGLLGLNLQISKKSEIVHYGEDRRFFEYYHDSFEVQKLLSISGFYVEAFNYGETGRNTHELGLCLKWLTAYARPRVGHCEVQVDCYQGTKQTLSVLQP